MAMGQGSWRELVADHGRYQRPVGRPGEMEGRQLLFHRSAGDYRSGGDSVFLRGARPLERSGHARSRQRWNDGCGVPFSFQFVGDPGAPLIAGNDLRSMRPEIHDILTNKEVIAVDQDAMGLQGERVVKGGDSEVWAKQLKDGSRAAVLLNRGSGE